MKEFHRARDQSKTPRRPPRHRRRRARARASEEPRGMETTKIGEKGRGRPEWRRGGRRREGGTGGRGRRSAPLRGIEAGRGTRTFGPRTGRPLPIRVDPEPEESGPALPTDRARRSGTHHRRRSRCRWRGHTGPHSRSWSSKGCRCRGTRPERSAPDRPSS